MVKPRKRWTSNDDRLIRKFRDEGMSDAHIGRIIGRSKIAVQRRRNRLGVPPIGTPGAPCGFKMPDDARARSGEASRQRWKDPAYRDRMLPEALRGLAKANATKFRRPPPGTEENRHYCKLRDVLGVERARQEMGLA